MAHELTSSPAKATRPAVLLLILLSFLFSSASVQAQVSNDIADIPVDSLLFNEARVEQVFQALSSKVGVSVTPLGAISNEEITLIAKDTTLEGTLDKITKSRGWRYWKADDGSGYNVSDEAYFIENELPKQAITKIFRPDHIKVAELEGAISDMLTPGIGRITPDARTNKLIVFDLPEVIERIERLIREIDVQLFTRVFYIRHSDVADLASKIESYKSEPGTIEVDETTRQIIVTDLLSNIKKMELLIDIIDVGPEIVIYDVNNIGLEGSDLEELQAIIENIRTSEELLFEINEKQGVFILEDVPEVHEQVEQILAGFDQPVKQVLIQGEIITTSFTRGFSFGVDTAAVSSDPIVQGLTPVGFTPLGGTTEGANNVESFIGLTGDTISGGFLGETAKLEYSMSFSDTNSKVLLQPRLLVKNQESSRIFVGREEPFLQTFFNDNGTNNNGVTRSTSQSTVTDGLNFEVTPSISNSYLVEMELTIENDDAEVVQRTSDGNTSDLIARDRQQLDTVLTIPSGQTRVIGGLITSSDNQSDSGVPFLSKLPIIGGIFGKKTDNKAKTNLQLFITPTIVEDVLPRPTGVDGKRGRTVTGFEKVPGNYDLNANATFSNGGSTSESATSTEVSVDDLLADDEDLDAESEIDSLLMRDTTPRDEMSDEN